MLFLVVCLVAAACSSGTSDTSAIGTGPTTTQEPTATTTTVAAPTTSTLPPTTVATTTTSLVVPPAACAVELPTSDTDEVLDAELAAYSVGTGSTLVWSIALGDRPVRLDTVGDRAYVGAFDGFVASFDVDPCGLDWLAAVPDGVSDVIATTQHVFAISREALSVIEPIEGGVESFPLGGGLHQAAAGPDVLVVSNGSSVVLYDYVTQQPSTLQVAGPVVGVASADSSGMVVGHGITVELRTWLGAPVWARDLPDPVTAVAASGDLVAAVLTSNTVVAFDATSGDLLWEQPFTGAVSVGPIDHDELHVLEVELGAVARHHHLDPADGSSIFVSESSALGTFSEYDDGLLLIADQGAVTGRSLLEQDLWTIPTGADGLSRFTEVDLAAGLVIALSYSAERF